MTDWTQEAIEGRIRDRIRDRIEEPEPSKVKRPESRPTAVVVTDVHMSFGSMVAFMVKWAVASIPALLILLLLGLVCWTIGLALVGAVGFRGK